MKTIIDLRNDLDNNVVTSENLFKEANFKAHKYQEEYNSFVTINGLQPDNSTKIQIIS